MLFCFREEEERKLNTVTVKVYLPTAYRFHDQYISSKSGKC